MASRSRSRSIPCSSAVKFKYEGAVVSIPANRLGILCKFKLPEPQIATLQEKEVSQLPPWRKSSLWGPKPLSPPVYPIFRAIRPQSSQLPALKALGSQNTSVFRNAITPTFPIFRVPAEQLARAIKPPELGGSMQKKPVFAWPHKKKEESGS